MIAGTVSEQRKTMASPPFGGASGYRLPDDRAAQHYAAIIESSEDAILSKDLDGVITSWNHSAERLFGYAPEEVVRRPVTILIPGDRENEEPMILERIRRGERIEHYETVRRRKDGTLVDISLTVSPIRDPAGKIIGASKIARDITERRRAHERRQLLLGEMNHRIKNLFALAISVVSLSARSATTVEELTASSRERLLALARAHDLTLSRDSINAPHVEMPTTLHSLIQAIVAPYESIRDADAKRFEIVGPDIAISGAAVSSLALLLNEFSTNSAKYGALSSPEGQIRIDCAEEGAAFVLTWTERNGPAITSPEESEGFGSILTRAAAAQLGGEMSKTWKPEGLVIRLSAPRARLTSIAQQEAPAPAIGTLAGR
jgi:PAS domain S-box-containing protein